MPAPHLLIAGPNSCVGALLLSPGATAAEPTGGSESGTASSFGGPRFTAGAPGVGDPSFPFAGNGGYDVKHYGLELKYTPPQPDPAPLVGKLNGVATIDLVATQNLDRFTLDLRGMDVKAITINGHRPREVPVPANGAKVGGAAYWQVQDDAARVWELTVQPRQNLKKARRRGWW